MLYPKFISCNCDFSKFCCGLGEEFPKARIWSYTFSKCLYAGGRILINDDHKTRHRSQLIPKDDKRVSLSTTLPRILEIVRRKQAQKSHRVAWLVGIVRHLSIKKNLNKAVYSFQTFFPLIQWCASWYEIVFRISTTSENHILKLFMLACKSILVKFHLRD